MKNKNTIILILCLPVFVLGILTSPVSGQQIKINSGAYLKNSGAVYIKIDNVNLINEGTYAKGTETVAFSGTSAKTISGISNIDLNNLSVTNTGGITTQMDLLTTNNLTIGGSSMFTVDPVKSVLVNGTLTNNAGNEGLVIKSGATGDGKIIYNSAVSGTVELYLTGGSSYFHFFAPPVSTMAIGSTVAAVQGSLGLTSFNGDLMSYSESAAGANQNLGWQYHDGYTAGGVFSVAPFSDLVSSKGYNIYLTAADKITFKGSLNAAPHSFTLNRSLNCLGWNLVGNPYPCNYDLTGVSALTTSGNGVDKSIYFAHNGSYAFYNMTTGGTTGYTSIVPPMQGFFVHVMASGNSLILPAASKTVSASTPRSKGSAYAEAGSIGKIKMVLGNTTVSDETIVCLIENATTGFDGDYDAYKLFGSSTTVPDIYTELSSVKYAINSVPVPVSEAVRIPVTVVLKTQGTYKIDLTEFENLGGINVVLKHGVTETNLSKNASYSFTSAAGTFTDFALIFGGTATGLENPVNGKFKTWYSNNFLYINCPSDITTGDGTLIIYDMQGKPVYNNKQVYMTPGQTIQLPLLLPKGLYITRIIVSNLNLVSKFFVLN